jgi:hypothetical protein
MRLQGATDVGRVLFIARNAPTPVLRLTEKSAAGPGADGALLLRRAEAQLALAAGCVPVSG